MRDEREERRNRRKTGEAKEDRRKKEWTKEEKRRKRREERNSPSFFSRNIFREPNRKTRSAEGGQNGPFGEFLCLTSYMPAQCFFVSTSDIVALSRQRVPF